MKIGPEEVVMYDLSERISVSGVSGERDVVHSLRTDVLFGL